jgi:hypothetical protein
MRVLVLGAIGNDRRLWIWLFGLWQPFLTVAAVLAVLAIERER